MTSITVITPTCGRSSLQAAIDSVFPQLGLFDQHLVVGDGLCRDARTMVFRQMDKRVRYFSYGPTNFFGNAQRNYAVIHATGEWLMFLDDDDTLKPDALETIRKVARSLKAPRPMMFCVQGPFWFKWSSKVFCDGNVTGSGLVIPNLPGRIPKWPASVSECGHWRTDNIFAERLVDLWKDVEPVPSALLEWREEQIINHYVTGRGIR